MFVTWLWNGHHFHPEFKIGAFIDHNPGLAVGRNIKLRVCHCGSHDVQLAEEMSCRIQDINLRA